MRGRRQLAVAMTAAGLALGLGACGDDEEPAGTTSTTKETTSTTDTTSSTTETTSPTTSTTDTTASTTTEATTTSTTEDESGGGSGGSGPRGDSEHDDKPPVEGSPEARFEEFCDENPKECG